jgi:hypothetical protein
MDGDLVSTISQRRLSSQAEGHAVLSAFRVVLRVDEMMISIMFLDFTLGGIQI